MATPTPPTFKSLSIWYISDGTNTTFSIVYRSHLEEQLLLKNLFCAHDSLYHILEANLSLALPLTSAFLFLFLYTH
ncbi:hypothetical protein P167DRAFT_252123 [Morchella conica CCBAS932]|uniref:Uncharacterized protein n=1 Tax=Morchella conica CCBAS932 TaxID=1392247 RepID=A0A3N4KIK4_9PEZI|nr:hypothetical protein P167DRAFT_252123 [Morchella conica CCBAS932]